MTKKLVDSLTHLPYYEGIPGSPDMFSAYARFVYNGIHFMTLSYSYKQVDILLNIDFKPGTSTIKSL